MGISKRLQSYRASLRRIRALSTTCIILEAIYGVIPLASLLTGVFFINLTGIYEEPPRWLPVAVVNTDVNPHFSRPFLESLPNTTIVKRTYLEVAQAIASTERYENSGVIIIGNDFSTVLESYLRDEIEQNKTTVRARINIDIDSPDVQTAYILRITIYRSFEVSWNAQRV